MNAPIGIFVGELGDIYFADTKNHWARRVDPSGVIATVAGNGNGGLSGDRKPATTARLNASTGVFVDGSGKFYMADVSNHRIRKVDTSGIITTVAGSGTLGFAGEGGLETEARLLSPSRIFTDALGSLYIADAGNHRILKVDAGSGRVSTVAGSGDRGFFGDGGSATEASLDGPSGVFVDSEGNLYIADRRNHRIRKVDGGVGPDATGSWRRVFLWMTTALSTFRIRGGSGRWTPNRVRFRRLRDRGTFRGFLGDGGPATDASLSASGIFMDAEGNLYVANARNHRIRKIERVGALASETVERPEEFSS